jgi:hypothetical protein
MKRNSARKIFAVFVAVAFYVSGLLASSFVGELSPQQLTYLDSISLMHRLPAPLTHAMWGLGALFIFFRLWRLGAEPVTPTPDTQQEHTG